MTLSKNASEEKNSKYTALVSKLYDVCNELLLQNERCVLRINKVKSLLRQQKRDKAILKRRLAKYKDNWRSFPIMMAPHPKRKIEQKRGPKPKVKSNNKSSNNIEGNATEGNNRGITSATGKKKMQRKPKKTKAT